MDTTRKPSWLRAKVPGGPGYQAVRRLVDANQLHTVCQSAQCPNLGECWSRGTATVMILGNICTRSCNFCAIATGRPTELDLGEPARVADAVAKMNLRHCVITSVARDELADGGASVWAATIRAVRHRNPQTAIEVLTPDFKGNTAHVDVVLDAKPDIFNHNIETVERLQKPVRVQARYDRSRGVLRHAKGRGFVTKTGIMLGLGEEQAEIEQTMRDIAAASGITGGALYHHFDGKEAILRELFAIAESFMRTNGPWTRVPLDDPPPLRELFTRLCRQALAVFELPIHQKFLRVALHDGLRLSQAGIGRVHG